MNLEELQIKISIELKDLEKQLKSITKSIDKTLGPKTTKKLMQDNHRVIKAESIAINKTLNKAFDVDYKKFNTNLNSAMNQAKLTVRSACNDIRRELNNALNVKANIRVTGKTSLTGSSAGKSDPTATSNMASSQYIGAMIIKATNAILKDNASNTKRLEDSLNKSTDKIVKAIKNIKIDSKPTHISSNNNEDVVRAINSSTRDIIAAINNINTQDKKTNQKSTTTKKSTSTERNEPKLLTNSRQDQKALITSGINFELKEAGKQISEITKEMKDAVKVINIFKRNFSNLLNNFNTKQLGTGSYGNEIVKTNRPLGEAKKIFTGEVIDPETIPIKTFEKLQNIIEIINYEIKDTEVVLANIESRALSIVKAFKGLSKVSSTLTGEVVNPGIVPVEAFEQIPDIIEGVWREIPPVNLPLNFVNFQTDEIIARVRETNEHIKQAFKDAQNLRKQANISVLAAPIEETKVDMELFKEIVGQAIAIIMDLKALEEYFNSDSMDIDKAAKDAYELGEALIDIEEAAKKLDGYDLSGLGISDGVTDELKPFVDTLERAWILIGKIANYNPKPKAPTGIPIDLEQYDVNNLLNPPKPEKPQIVKAIKVEELNLDDFPDEIPISVVGTYPGDEAFTKDLKRIEDEVEIPVSVVGTYPGDEAFAQELKDLEKEVEINIDTTEAKEKLDELAKQVKEKMAGLVNTESDLKTSGSYKTSKGNALIGRTGPLVKGPIIEKPDDGFIKDVNDAVKSVELDSFNKKVKEGKKSLDSMRDVLNGVIQSLGGLEGEPIENINDALQECQKTLRKMGKTDLSHFRTRDLKDINNDLAELKEKFGEDIDTSEYEELINLFNTLENSMKNLKKYSKNFNSLSKALEEDSFFNVHKALKNAERNVFGEGDDDSLGFLPYKQQLDKIVEYAKKAGSKIKEALFNSDSQVLGFAPYQNELHELGELAKKIGAKIKNELSNAFNKVGSKAKSSLAEIRANAKDYNKVSQIQNADGSTSHSFSKAFKTYAKDYYGATDDVIKVVDKLEDAYKKASNRIKKIMKNMGQSIADAPKKGLNKLVSTAKTIWSKITGIFKKGASDSIKATDKLKTGLGDLLKQALGFLSLYSLINLGKQAIEQSQMLAQAEVKLASLMKQRMGATNETISVIRQLAEEQAQLGVVSETAMKHGAQQLAMYVHSAQALKTLMPAIANLTARRGGVFATEDDAEEIATQLGEAIREGTTTPLEQSGIYLSEAEIQKFAALRTEEERAAYLADVIAKNVGNINEALANTPHGAIAQLKNNFQSLLGTLGIFLANVIKPIVQWLNVIVVACNNALKALGKLLGFDMTGGAESVPDVNTGSTGGSTPVDTTTPEVDTGGIDDAKDAYEDAKDAADEATEANEKFKGSLMGFDEINILSDNTQKSYESDSGSDPSDEYDPTDITPGVGGQLPAVGELTEGENIFGEFSDKMKAFIDEVLEPFKAAWDLLGDRWKAAWADLKDSFKNFCDSLANFLKSVWENGGKEFVQHMAEIALAVGIAAMEIGGTILDALAKLWDHLDPEKNMHTQRLLDVLNEVAVKLRDFILGLNEHLEHLLEYGGQDVLNAMGDCFMDLAAAAVNAFGVVIDAVDGLIDHLDPKFNVDTRNMLQATADMFHAVGTAAWDFSELLKSALANGGQDMINAFGTCVVNLGETAARVITTMMESFSKFFDYIDPAKNEITKNMMKAWEDAFYAIGDAALQFAELFESIMGNGGQEVLNKLGDAFNSLVGLVGTVVKEIADALNGLFEHLNPKTNEFTKGMLKAWQDAFDGISEMCKKIGEVLGSVMDNGGQELLNSIGDLAMQVLETFGNLVEEVADCIGSLFEHLDPGKNQVAKGAIDAFKYFVDSIRNFVEMLGNALGTFMDNGGQEFINNVGDIVALLLDLGATIGGDILNAITAFMDSWAGHALISACATALEIISEVLEGLLRILEPLSPVISAVVTAIGTFMVAQKVVGFIEGLVGVFKLLSGSGGALALAKAGFTALWGIIAANPVAAVIAAIAAVGVALVALYNKCEGFREFADKVLEGFKGAFDKIKEHCSKLLEDIREIFGNVIDIITGIFEGDGEKVGEAVRNLIINILELIHNMNQAFVEIGWELIKGLVKGIWECVKAIPDLLMGIGEFIVDFFKGLFGIHSPSTVFAELGVNLIEGLIEGIKSMMDAIGEAITAIVDSILEAFSGITEKLSEVWNSIKENVSEAWNTIKDTVVDKCKETLENVKEKYDNIRDTVSEKLGEVKEKASDAWTKIKENTSDLVSKMKDEAEDKYNKLKDKLTDTMEDWRQKSEDKWNKVKEKTTDIVSKLKDDAEDKYNKLKEALTTTMDNWKKNSEEKWNNIKDKTSDLVSKLKDETEDKYNKFKEALTNTMENLRKNSEDKWTNIKNKTTELAENLKTTVEDKYNRFKQALTNTLENLRSTSQDKWTNIKDKTASLVENLKTSVEDKYNKLKSNLASKMSDIKSDMETKWNNIKERATSLVENLRSTVESKFNTLKTNLASKMSEIKSNIETKWGEIKTNAINKASEVVTNVTTKYNELKTNVTNKMAEVKSNAKTKWEELKTDAKSGAEGMVKKAGEGLSGLSKTLTDAIDKAKTAASNAWDKLKNVFSSSSFNFPELPQIKIEWETITGNNWFPDVKFPKLSWNARGGIIDGITPLGFANGALQMGGEQGKEMVVPLENTSFTTKIAQAIGQAVDNTLARQSNPYNQHYNAVNDKKDIVLKVNERELARASIDSINKLQRESGRTLLDI